MLAAMMDHRGRERAYISATMIASPCLRKVRLEQEVPYAASPLQLFPAVRGRLGHLLTEGWPEPGAVYEVRFETRITLPNGKTVTLTGQIDKLSLAKGEITDFKTKERSLPAKPEPAHIFQLNCYRYLVYHGWPQEEITHDSAGNPVTPIRPGTPARITIAAMRLFYWQPPYGRKHEHPVVELAVPEVDIDDEILDRLARYTDHNLPDVPPHLDPYQSAFCCHWCSVNTACRRHLEDAAGF
jgi:hypothetical protein